MNQSGHWALDTWDTGHSKRTGWTIEKAKSSQSLLVQLMHPCAKILKGQGFNFSSFPQPGY